jgi:hypothetical protein
MILCGKNYIENIGYIVASGWDFPETSHMVLTCAVSSLGKLVHCFIDSSSAVSKS